MFSYIKNYIDSFKYYVLIDELITWDETKKDGTQSTWNSVVLTKLENGRGKRKIEKGYNQYPNTCVVETHPYWQKVIVPWLNEPRKKDVVSEEQAVLSNLIAERTLDFIARNNIKSPKDINGSLLTLFKLQVLK